MNDDLIARVCKWLEESGRVLELRVARTLRQVGEADAELSYTYTDTNSNKLREGDVKAQFCWTAMNQVSSSITVAIECKSSRDHPWVAVHSGREQPRREGLNDWVLSVHGPFNGVTQHLPVLWRGLPPFEENPVASHVLTAHDGKNPANDAVRQALSAAAALKAEYLKRQQTGLVLLAAVITAAPLLTCRLDERGEVHLKDVPQFDVWGYTPDGRRSRVYVRSEDALPQFAEDLRERALEAGRQAAS